jgi:hypothetical protein
MRVPFSKKLHNSSLASRSSSRHSADTRAGPARTNRFQRHQRKRVWRVDVLRSRGALRHQLFRADVRHPAPAGQGRRHCQRVWRRIESGGVRGPQRRHCIVAGDDCMRGAVRRRCDRARHSRTTRSGIRYWRPLATAAGISARCTCTSGTGSGCSCTGTGEVARS